MVASSSMIRIPDMPPSSIPAPAPAGSAPARRKDLRRGSVLAVSGLPAALDQFNPDRDDRDEHDHDKDQVDVRPDPVVTAQPEPEQGHAHTPQEGADCVEGDEG